MKLVVFVMFFLNGLISFGQGLNGEMGFNDDYYQFSDAIVVQDEYSYFVKRQFHSQSYFTTCSLLKVDTMENIVWSSQITPQFVESVEVHELIPSENNGLYLLGHAKPTCDIGTDCFWFVMKYDSTGLMLWIQTWSDQDCFDANLAGLSMCDTNLFVNYSNSSESKIYTIDIGAGLIMDSLEINYSNLKGIDSLSNFDKIAFKQDSIFGFDINGNVSTSIGFSSSVKNIKVLNDTIFVLTSDSVYSFDNNFVSIASSNIPVYSAYSNLKVKSNKIEFLSHSSNNQSIITVNHDLTLNSVLDIPVVIGTNELKDFSETHFSTTINFSLSEFTAIRHLDYSRKSIQNNSVNTTDIGIIGIQPTQVSAVPYPSSPGVYYYTIYADVLIKNFGPNLLNDCRINHNIGMSPACGYNFYTEHFTNLNLAPNDSMWISLGLVHSKSNFLGNGLLTETVCIYTSHPNFKTDLNVPNDKLCKTIVLGYADLLQIETNVVSIYPNPTKDNISVNLNLIANTISYSLLTTDGKTVFRGNQNSVLNFDLDLTQEEIGIYFLHVNVDGVSSVVKILKQ